MMSSGFPPDANPGASAPLGAPLEWTIEGDISMEVGAAMCRYGLTTVECRTQCTSGDSIDGRWRGVPLAPVLEEVDPETTHLLVGSGDGFRACVDVHTARGAILALERLDAEGAGFPRLVGAAVDGPRLAKRIDRIETLTLSPSVDPTDLERLTPEDDP